MVGRDAPVTPGSDVGRAYARQVFAFAFDRVRRGRCRDGQADQFLIGGEGPELVQGTGDGVPGCVAGAAGGFEVVRGGAGVRIVVMEPSRVPSTAIALARTVSMPFSFLS
ncbi:hypothetical protein HUF15_40485 [Streptomyces samsunensis]|uniref:hypothetical protein n=1 Tax=Streptomyces malaysiensis TaxID=92644 RepID=UPI0015841FB8|nr:hypothetical protein [Streptomyces samsunensis]NUH42899.1 hypothetical protein [Streptomyces samsunensis]